MRGEEKDITTVWLTLGQRTLRYETYVMPAPEENHAAALRAPAAPQRAARRRPLLHRGRGRRLPAGRAAAGRRSTRTSSTASSASLYAYVEQCLPPRPSASASPPASEFFVAILRCASAGSYSLRSAMRRVALRCAGQAVRTGSDLLVAILRCASAGSYSLRSAMRRVALRCAGQAVRTGSDLLVADLRCASLGCRLSGSGPLGHTLLTGPGRRPASGKSGSSSRTTGPGSRGGLAAGAGVARYPRRP